MAESSFIKQLALLIFIKEALGRVMRIQGHFEMMHKACDGCNTFEMFGKPIDDEIDEAVNRLEKVINAMEGKKEGV